MKQNSKDKNNKKLVIEIAKTDTKEIVICHCSVRCLPTLEGRLLTNQLHAHLIKEIEI